MPDAEVWVSLAIPSLDMGDSVQRNTILGKPARDCFSTRTDADGHFRLANLPVKTQVNLAVRKAGLGKRVPANFVGKSSYTSGEEAIKLMLDPPASIEGRVTAQGTGQPLSGVMLRWLGASGGLSELDTPDPVLSDTNGSFRIADVVSGTAAVSARFPVALSEDWVAEDVPLTLASGESKKDVQVVAVQGGVAEVSVSSEDEDQPLANANITFPGQASGFSYSAATGADGTARLRLPPGTWLITAGKEGWDDEGFSSVIIATGQTNQVAVTLNPIVKITGTVRDPGGAPVAGVIISTGQGSGGRHEVKTDAYGRYELRRSQSLDPGWGLRDFDFGDDDSSSLMARSADGNLVATHEINDSTTNLDLKLKPAVTISSEAMDETGKPDSQRPCKRVGDKPEPGGSAFRPRGHALHLGRPGPIGIAGLFRGGKHSFTFPPKAIGSISQQIPAPDRETNRIDFAPDYASLGQSRPGRSGVGGGRQARFRRQPQHSGPGATVRQHHFRYRWQVRFPGAVLRRKRSMICRLPEGQRATTT